MSVNIETKDNVITISYLNWSIPLHMKDGEFNHYGIPIYYGKIDYTVSDGCYYDHIKSSFLSTSTDKHPDTKEVCAAAVNIGYMNKDNSYGDYATVSVSKSGFKIKYATCDKLRHHH